jgi:glycosyltransferase involved in cell wall biosynthesis
MASVIRVFAEHDVGADMVRVSPTWKPSAPLATARLVGAATRALLQMPPLQIAHVHLSERGSFLREGSLVALARRRGLVTVATLHGASFVPFALSHPRLVSSVSRRAHLITCLEQETLDVVRRCAPEVRSEIVANPVAVEESFVPADQTDEVVVFAGEIGLRKGADVLYRAWQIVARRRPQARCLMVGPSTDFAPPGTERLELRTSVKPGEMREILRGARVVALPSRAEGMPMILTEAMSLGRPFVSTPVGAIPALASEGGIIVPVDDASSLADRLTDLLAKPDLARAIGERGRRFCLETRSVEVMDRRFRELYAVAGEIALDATHTRGSAL